MPVDPLVDSGNLAAVLESRSVRRGWGPRIAFACGDRLYSHQDVHDGAARASSFLGQLGLARGGVVLIALSDGVGFVWTFLGAIRLGALAIPVNPLLTADDHRYLVEDCAPDVVVCEPELAERFRGCYRVVTALDVLRSVPEMPLRPPANCGAGEAAYAQYTSGTTGRPRAALHRHGDPLVYSEAFASAAMAISPDDVLLSVSKMYFAYGLGNSLFFPLLSGARSVLMADRPLAADVTDLAEHHRVTVLFGVPTFYAGLLRSPAPQAAFASLRVAVSAGECLSPALAERIRRFLGCPVLDGLGSTEVGQTFVSNTLTEARAGTIGRALPPYEVAVRDGSGRRLAAGQVGHLSVRGPTVMLGYLDNPEATVEAIDVEWLRTGDLASLDADGFVHHHGRADDMEMVGGISVAPREIEDLLSRHPAVEELAVAAVAGEDGASRLTAFVVAPSSDAESDVVAGELLAMARTALAPYKVPRSVHFVEALPRTATGKLRRFVLRAGWPGRKLDG